MYHYASLTLMKSLIHTEIPKVFRQGYTLIFRLHRFFTSSASGAMMMKFKSKASSKFLVDILTIFAVSGYARLPLIG